MVLEAPQSNLREGRVIHYDNSRDKKYEKMRNSQEYKTMLQKNIDWLKQLDAQDSNPNNGRVDVSVFNAKVSQFGYEATPDVVGYARHGIGVPKYSQDVDIQKQAQSMTDKYYAKQFGL